jgi:hypothetical protein
MTAYADNLPAAVQGEPGMEIAISVSAFLCC